MRAKRAPDERKRAAILQAAIDLFLKNGYSNTSMDAIAAKAGVTKQTVYAHCKSKDALFALIVTELAQKHSPPGWPAIAKKTFRSKTAYMKSASRSSTWYRARKASRRPN